MLDAMEEVRAKCLSVLRNSYDIGQSIDEQTSIRSSKTASMDYDLLLVLICTRMGLLDIFKQLSIESLTPL